MSTNYAPHPYHRTVEFAATLRDRAVRIVSKPGFANWDRVSPAAALLAESVSLRPDARVLHLGCGHGGLGVFLARGVPQGSVLLIDANYAATLMAGQTLLANQIMNARGKGAPAPAPPEAGSVDVAVLEAPAGCKFAGRWLALCHAALAP